MSYITVLLSVASFLEARAAINGSVAGGLESKLCLATALRACSDEVLTLASLRIFLFVAAGLAALGLILKSLFSVELLLTRCEYKFLTAISASKGYVFINDFLSNVYFYFVFTHCFFTSLYVVSEYCQNSAFTALTIYKTPLWRFYLCCYGRLINAPSFFRILYTAFDTDLASGAATVFAISATLIPDTYNHQMRFS